MATDALVPFVTRPSAAMVFPLKGKQVIVLHEKWWKLQIYYFDGLGQDCSNSSALAMELLQSCTKSSICFLK